MFRVTTRLRFIEPQLASLVDQPPEGKHSIHEIKHDGYAPKCWLSEEKPVSSAKEAQPPANLRRYLDASRRRAALQSRRRRCDKHGNPLLQQLLV